MKMATLLISSHLTPFGKAGNIECADGSRSAAEGHEPKTRLKLRISEQSSVFFRKLAGSRAPGDQRGRKHLQADRQSNPHLPVREEAARRSGMRPPIRGPRTRARSQHQRHHGGRCQQCDQNVRQLTAKALSDELESTLKPKLRLDCALRSACSDAGSSPCHCGLRRESNFENVPCSSDLYLQWMHETLQSFANSDCAAGCELRRGLAAAFRFDERRKCAQTMHRVWRAATG